MTQQKRYKQIGDEFLTKLKGKSDKTTFDITGPQTVPVPHPSNPQQQVLDVGWWMMVTLEHDKLVGQGAIHGAIPVRGGLPVDEHIRAGIKACWEKCVELRDEANAAPEEPPPGEHRVDIKANGKVFPSPPKVSVPRRERVSHFPSKRGSGDFLGKQDGE